MKRLRLLSWNPRFALEGNWLDNLTRFFKSKLKAFAALCPRGLLRSGLNIRSSRSNLKYSALMEARAVWLTLESAGDHEVAPNQGRARPNPRLRAPRRQLVVTYQARGRHHRAEPKRTHYYKEWRRRPAPTTSRVRTIAWPPRFPRAWPEIPRSIHKREHRRD